MAAEKLAWSNLDTHAVIYRPVDGPRSSFKVQLASDKVTEGLEIVTTVSRKPLPNGLDEGSCEELVDALAFVMFNVPHNVELARVMKVDYSANGKIWSYNFLSTNQEEIASWYSSEFMIDFHPGYHGSGRPITVDQKSTIVNIEPLLLEARSLLPV